MDDCRATGCDFSSGSSKILKAKTEPEAELGSLPTLYRCPVCLLFIILLSVIATEIGIMLVLDRIVQLPPTLEAIIDGVSLTLILSPVFYYFLYRPLMRHIEARGYAEEEIMKLAHFDSLTGLFNRALFEDHLKRALALAERGEHPLALFFLDLDNFKEVNDQLGHSGGDQLLKMAAQRQKESLRNSDILARMGGDEFVILIPSFGHIQDVATVASKILDFMSPPFEIYGREIHVTPSIGISLFPADGVEAETLLQHADMAMYEAKKQGRNNYQFFSKVLSQPKEDYYETEELNYEQL